MVGTHPYVAGRWQQSIALTVGQLAVAVMNVFPGLVYPRNPATTKVVLQLAGIGPIWIIWFGLTGLGLVVALWTRKLLHLAHLTTGSAWFGFAFVLEVGAWANGGTHILPVVCCSLATVHWLLAASYSRDVKPKEAR